MAWQPACRSLSRGALLSEMPAVKYVVLSLLLGFGVRTLLRRRLAWHSIRDRPRTARTGDHDEISGFAVGGRKQHRGAIAFMREQARCLYQVVGGWLHVIVNLVNSAALHAVARRTTLWLRRRRIERIVVRDEGQDVAHDDCDGRSTAVVTATPPRLRTQASGRRTAIDRTRRSAEDSRGPGEGSSPPAFYSSLMVPGLSQANEGYGQDPAHVPSSLLSSGTSARKTLVLDLDETLVHSQLKMTEHCDLRLDVVIGENPAVFFVAKRPHLGVFLQTAAMWYNLVIFTASLQRYADPLITYLDPGGLVKRRLFRPSCLRREGTFVKDIQQVEPDLRNVIIVDNSPAAYAMHEANAIPIEAWYDDPADEELLNLLPLLHALAFLHDVRSLLSLRLANGTLAARRTRGRVPNRARNEEGLR